MEYLLLIYSNEADDDKLREAEQAAMYQEFGRFTQSIQQSGNFGLASSCSRSRPPPRCACAMANGG